MVFIDWLAFMRQQRTQIHPSKLYMCVVVLLASGTVLLRQVLLRAPARPWPAMKVVLESAMGGVALLLLALAVMLWVRLLQRYQLSFFYPLLGLIPLLVLLIEAVFFQLNVTLWAAVGACLILGGAAVLVRGGHSV